MYFEMPSRDVRWDVGPIPTVQPFELRWTDFYGLFTPLNDNSAAFAPAGSPPPPPPNSGGGLPGSVLTPWQCLGQVIAIPASVQTQVAILPSNPKRNFLLIQNNSSATGAGNVAPNLYVNLDGPVVVGPLTLTFAPGVGLKLDTRVPNNNIYVAWGTGTGTFVQGGVMIAGNNQDQAQTLPTYAGPHNVIEALVRTYAGGSVGAAL